MYRIDSRPARSAACQRAVVFARAGKALDDADPLPGFREPLLRAGPRRRDEVALAQLARGKREVVLVEGWSGAAPRGAHQA